MPRMYSYSDSQSNQGITNEEFYEMEYKAIKKAHSCVKEVKRHTKLVGRQKELQLLEESLYKKRMKNSVIVGAAGVGKTAIIEELAHKIKDKFRVLQLDLPSTVAGTRYRGEFEEKLTKILQSISEFNTNADKPIILFIDEIHTLARAGGAEGAIDAGNIVKPYLSNGEITIIGATTLEEYNHHIKCDSALSRRLSAIYVRPLEDAEIIKILKEFSGNTVSEQGLEYIYKKSKQIPSSQNPDVSIEILDRCMARSQCRNQDISNEMIDDIVECFLG